VIEVTDLQLQSILGNATTNDSFLVMFFSDLCPFSQMITPVYAAIAKAFPTVPVLKLNARKYQVLNYEYSIYGFPRILFMHGNKGSSLVKYEGNRTFQSIVEFIRSHTKLDPISGVYAELGADSSLSAIFPPISIDPCLYLSFLYCFMLFSYKIIPLSKWIHDEAAVQIPFVKFCFA